MSQSDPETSDVPENALVVDLRDKDKFDKWHYPGAVNTNLQGLELMLKQKDDRTYVFYCMKGLQSAYAASIARREGADAFYISEAKLRKKVEA